VVGAADGDEALRMAREHRPRVVLLDVEMPVMGAKQAMERMLADTKAPLQAEDIAEAIFYAVSQPAHVNVNEILVRPLEQSR
jgi:NADP-dependent 3-hydroxy acid dehydrogenase YdfG